MTRPTLGESAYRLRLETGRRWRDIGGELGIAADTTATPTEAASGACALAAGWARRHGQSWPIQPPRAEAHGTENRP